MVRAVVSSISAIALVLLGIIVPNTAALGSSGFIRTIAPTEDRVVFEDDFSNGGAKWNTLLANQSSTINFEQNMAVVKGSGPENRIISKDVVQAQTFTLDLDVYIGPENTNAALKFGFFSSADASSRYQVTWDGPNKNLRLEEVSASGTTVLEKKEDVDLPVNMGENAAHSVSIKVEENKVRVLVNGTEQLVAEVSGIHEKPAGHILVASQFPKQHYAIDHVRVSTTEPAPTGKYELTLQTKTNGVLDEADAASAGGSVSANRMAGDEGDEVSLSYEVKPGFVFAGWESFVTETQTSTDGLLTIENNRFVFNDKTGSVTIVAKFITEPNDPNVLFKDYFLGDFNDHGSYEISDPAQAEIVEGELEVKVGEKPTSLVVDNNEWPSTPNYQIDMDIRKANATAGTVQIAFRMGSDLADRYVVALNGSKLLIRKLASDGSNVELASTPYVFNEESRNLSIVVEGNVVSVSADNKPILSYENTDSDIDVKGWSELAPAFAIVNMTQGATVAVDNIRVVRNPVYVTAIVKVTNGGEDDPKYISGAASLSAYRVTAGDTITVTPMPKGGYETESISVGNVDLDDNTYTVPEGVTDDITVLVNFVAQEAIADGRTYYIDSESGNDEESGLAADRAWKSFNNLDRLFNPGDKILLKRGSVFEGAAAALRFGGSGTADAPILVSDYGQGALPKLNGLGEVENVVSLNNQEYITIENLDISNTHPDYDATFGLNASTNTAKNLRAVNVSAKDFGVVRGITIQNLYIHDINGNLSSKWNGGIFFDVKATITAGSLYGTPTKYDTVLIANNTLERVDRSGIKLVSSGWANQSLDNSPNTPLNWYPSTNVVVRDNVLRYMGGDAITVRDTDGALVEYNLAQHSRYQNTGYNAGIWPFEATNTVVQYNESSNTHGVQDGQGFDSDHVSSYTVMQYNYSHDNEGGFMLIMNGFPHTAPTIRYNISQNDADKTFEFARGTAAGTMIYNNTIYSDAVLSGRGGVFDLANWQAGTGNREIYIFNNVFHYPEGQEFYVGDPAEMKTKAKLINNAYYGGITPPAEEEKAITADPLLPGVGTAPETDLTASVPKTGKNVGSYFAGYIPQENSPLYNAGMSVAEVVAHYGGTTTDRRSMAPSELHALTRGADSIDFVAGEYLADVQGVTYNTDFLGNPLPSSTVETRAAVENNTGITIGAIQANPGGSEEPGEPGNSQVLADGATQGSSHADASDKDAGIRSVEADSNKQLSRSGLNAVMPAIVALMLVGIGIGATIIARKIQTRIPR